MTRARWDTPARRMVRAGLAVAGAALLAGCALTPRAPAVEPGSLVVRTFSLNAFNRHLDGQWQGIRAASDGRCYFVSSSHAHNRAGSFFRYDPRTDELRVLSNDLSALCGEDAAKQVPQGKVHCDIAEADGGLFFATHLAAYWPQAADGYTGSHLLRYDMATGAFRDYGIIRSNYTNYSGLGVDPARGQVYLFLTPFSERWKKEDGSRLYRVDLASGDRRDLGLLKAGGGSSQWFFVDRRGDCWFSLYDNGGALYCARAATGEVERWDNALPPVYRREKDEVEPDAGVQRQRGWRWAQPLPDGERCLFTLRRGGRLWLFDATRPVGAGFEPVAHIGPTELGVALAGNRVYYIQQDAAKAVHLMSVSLASRTMTDHGRIVDGRGRRPWRIHTLAADGRGRVFMVGDFHLLAGEKGSLSIEGLKAAPPDGRFAYEERATGQFFAVAQVGP